jgi:glutamate synthase (NADPH/NADH) small chain
VKGNMVKEKIPRQPMPEQKAHERKKNFNEVPLGFAPEIAILEAKRCLQCKKPKCVEGCPVRINIPGFIQLIVEEKFDEAAKEIKKQSCLPAVCGRVCPQEDQCEKVCILGIKDDPVNIGALERFAADWERERGKITIPKRAAPTGKKAAVIGSGPGGITVAGDLALKGHEVTLFEAFHKPGGVLVYGIPEFRLPKVIVQAECDYLKKLGAEIRTNMVIGRIKTIDELLNEGFDAVFVGIGAGLPMFLNIPGENLCGIYTANEYLTRSNLMKAYLFPKYDTPIAHGKNVCVIGGGNVAMDAARTALRLGAEKVTMVYRRTEKEMPARIDEIHHGREEGIQFQMLAAPVEFLGNKEGWVTGMKCIKMELGEPDDSGRRRPVPVEGSEHILDCDLIVIAVGSNANPLLPSRTLDMKRNKKGYIVVAPDTDKTTKKQVWAGGDIVTGAATVILAMGAGRKAADSIHKYLTSDQKAWPEAKV